MSRKQIIKNYAHDYRDISMSQDELQQMLESFLEEISSVTLKCVTMQEKGEISSSPGEMPNVCAIRALILIAFMAVDLPEALGPVKTKHRPLLFPTGLIVLVTASSGSTNGLQKFLIKRKEKE